MGLSKYEGFFKTNTNPSQSRLPHADPPAGFCHLVSLPTCVHNVVGQHRMQDDRKSSKLVGSAFLHQMMRVCTTEWNRQNGN